jgi:ferritin-like metal-binding protein YciE
MARKVDSLQRLFEEQLKDLYDAERQVNTALPRMAQSASHSDVQQALREHLDATKNQMDRLERIFGELGISDRKRKCRGMEGILRENDEIAGEVSNPDVRDAALITAAQRVEHYEMTGYGTARAYAEQLGVDGDITEMLSQSLEEENRTDKRLTRIAKEHINSLAVR